jgi:hypothetical protein
MSEPKLWDTGFIMMIVLFGMGILILATKKMTELYIKLFPKQQGGGSENTKTNIVLAFISVFIIYKIFSSY